MELNEKHSDSKYINPNNLENISQCNEGDKQNNTMYYGVHVPSEIQLELYCDGYKTVFQDKLEALKVVKQYKRARFKAFTFYHEAVDFAVHGCEFPNNTSEDNLFSVKSSTDSSQPIGEKPTLFRGPKSQDLVKLRKGIENGNLNFVHTTIWENPRYLISSGDTPSILQVKPINLNFSF